MRRADVSSLDDAVREGARRMLAAALEADVNTYLSRSRRGEIHAWAATRTGKLRISGAHLSISWLAVRLIARPSGLTRRKR
jgi:hypothetical protein